MSSHSNEEDQIRNRDAGISEELNETHGSRDNGQSISGSDDAGPQNDGSPEHDNASAPQNDCADTTDVNVTMEDAASAAKPTTSPRSPQSSCSAETEEETALTKSESISANAAIATLRRASSIYLYRSGSAGALLNENGTPRIIRPGSGKGLPTFNSTSKPQDSSGNFSGEIYSDEMYNTVEMKPAAKNYIFGEMMNPRLSLRFGVQHTKSELESQMKEKHDQANDLLEVKMKQDQLRTFGTFNGVVGRCLLNIWGVILFVRLGWVVAHAGIFHTTIIILISLVLTIITALSMSAICTNGEIGGGGTYYLISRALGPEWGASVGIIFSVANAVALSLYLIGFSETIVSLVGGEGITGSSIWDLRLIAIFALIFLTILCFVGVGWVVKFDTLQLAVLCTAILLCMIGTVAMAPDEALGFTGYTTTTFSTNWGPDYRDNEDFISVFSVFFPAVTGMLAGANISGELKDAQKSIPLGTIAAVLISTFVYMAIAWMLGATCLRDVQGAASGTAGLYFDFLILPKISVWAPLVYIGIFASTLSSALASLVGAPRILMAVCGDGLFPQLSYFAVGREKDNEPVRGYVLAFVIGIAFVMIGQLNQIAPIITQFFLFNRVLINYACFEAAWSKSPGWRPTFKWYSPILSLFCAICCVLIMFAINWWAALITLLAGYALYQYTKATVDPSLNFGEARQGVVFRAATSNLLRLQSIPAHVKNYRPLYLVLSQSHYEKESLLVFTDFMKAGHGLVYDAFITVGDFDEVMHQRYQAIAQNPHQFAQVPERRQHGSLSISRRKLSFFDKKGTRPYFREDIIAKTWLEGAQVLMQTSGVPGIRPNIILLSGCSSELGYPRGDIKNRSKESAVLVGAIVSALKLKLSVCVCHGLISEPANPQRCSVDIWWLSDTGGLTLLLPHLLCQHPDWKNADMRVFINGHDDSVGTNDVEILRLMGMLRLNVRNVEIADMFSEPKLANWEKFTDVQEDSRQHAKVSHYLRLNECMKERSQNSDAIFVSLPLPQTSKYSDQEYIRWLDAIVQDIKPPIILVRGNQSNVLSMHS